MKKQKPSRLPARLNTPNVSGGSERMSDTAAEKQRAAYRSGVADAIWTFRFSTAIAIRINVTDAIERDLALVAVGAQLDVLEEQLR